MIVTTGVLLQQIGVFLELSSDNTLLDGGELTTLDIYSIDSKMDGGNARTGILQALRGWNVVGSNVCVGVAIPSPEVHYIFDDPTTSCKTFYLIEAYD